MSDFQTERTKSDSTSNQKIDRNQMSFRDALREAFIQEMDRDPDIIQLGEDIAGGANLPHLEGDESLGGSFGVTANLSKKFGRKRIIDTPISETAYVGAACGAAILGLRPIIEIQFMSFFLHKESYSPELENQLSNVFPHLHIKLYLIMVLYYLILI